MQQHSDQAPDIREHGARGQTSDRRLFMQLLAFTGCRDTAALVAGLAAAGHVGALYEDVSDPAGVALLSLSTDPEAFVGPVRQMLQQEPFASLQLRPELTMIGRTYALGYEPDLEETLIRRPRRTALNPDWPWVIWYPLRRSGEFEQLDSSEQREILMEHGRIGMGFGRADFAHDIRLACHGLDRQDSDFVIGVVGQELHPLSALVQTMRSTVQTSTYLERLGPFFVGRARWQSGLGA
ncbi:MAG: chlorite dismutase family protein [Phycisphaeraceae bacterium]